MWCINKGVDIINLSVGYKLPNARLRKVCIEAYKQGIILVASAGNNCSGASFPATYKEVISVGAIDENKKHCTFSNIWPSTDVSAPGQNIFSLKLKDKKYDQAYALYSGTSFAAPHITGALALAVSCLKKNKKKFEPKILKQILKETAHKPQQDTKELEKLIKEFGLDLMDQQIQPEEMLRYMYGAGTLNTTAFLKKVIQQYNI
ncbi:MAG: S8 family serine peptidase [Candidatus Woesearchaeota archaeon]